MASSSYCDLVVTLKNGSEIGWFGEDGFSPIFQVPKNAKKDLTKMTTMEQLHDFILSCASVYEDLETAKATYYNNCPNFDKALKNIRNLKEIKSLYLGWGEFDPEDGLPPEEACEGESIEFDFETKKCKKKTTPNKDFIKEMTEIYGDLFDEFEN